MFNGMFSKGYEKTTQLLKQHLLFHQLISAPRASKISNLKLLQQTLSTSFSIPLKLSIISGFVTKSSLTVDTAFRKDSTLQGCTVSHTYQPTLSSTCTLFQGAR